MSVGKPLQDGMLYRVYSGVFVVAAVAPIASLKRTGVQSHMAGFVHQHQAVGKLEYDPLADCLCFVHLWARKLPPNTHTHTHHTLLNAALNPVNHSFPARFCSHSTVFVVDPSEMEGGGGISGFFLVSHVHISYIYVLHLRKFSVVCVLCKCVCVERGGYI